MGNSQSLVIDNIFNNNYKYYDLPDVINSLQIQYYMQII
jgi:hypothetical protein